MKPLRIQMEEYSADGSITANEKIIDLRKQIEEVFDANKGQTVNLNFAGVNNISPESAHQLIGKLVLKYSKVRIEMYLNIIDCNESTKDTIVRAIEYAKQNEID